MFNHLIRRSRNALLPSLALLCVLVWWSACTPQEEEFTPDAGALLRFEADSVVFDTVFTEVGSITKRLKVYNPHKKAVRISEIKVGGLGNSPFQVLVNGRQGPQLHGVELLGGDSLLVLVKAAINPHADDTPFLVNDSILFLTNGNEQKVKLVAYGQNATYFRRNYQTACAETWAGKKAFVIYDSVTVPAGCTLTIEKGVQVYLQNKAKLKVLGTLNVMGTHEERVRFQQIRQEEPYRNAPGQWQGIEFRASSPGSVLRYVEIKNAVTGLKLMAQGASSPEVTVEHGFLKNMLQAGVLSVGGKVQLVNSVVTNCGEYALAGLGGGNYKILYSTIANYSSDFIRNSASVVFQERYVVEGKVQREAPYQAEVVNSILWGRLDEELQLGGMGAGSGRSIRYSFVKTLLHKGELEAGALRNQVNVDPRFVDGEKFNFQLIKLSPANKAGTPLPGLLLDYENKPRDPATPDVGAFEVDF
ncbi:hypothetical protein [Rufibacter quisquiliarum]|uniref:Lipoprotein n=1 Tax=Rufibacter quisquiliarum TaxID=1549639 RepID=A0A839GGS7_9BACT|nr:hypothetical protein [Rufibacter quisquiliarum]MBA9075869.1 hypothetical protein [Rufibacter quisquiliarum]